MLLDNDLENYNHKAVAIAGVSNGPYGGARMIESLIIVLRRLGMGVLKEDLFFPFVQNIFNNNVQGQKLIDEQKERIRKIYTDLIWMAKTLKWGRSNLSTFQSDKHQSLHHLSLNR